MKNLKLATGLILVLPSLSGAHTMSPGFEVVRTPAAEVMKEYTIQNNYEFPAVYKIEVLNKNMEPVEGWTSEKMTYKLLPTSKKPVRLTFVADKKRKLHVCSTLTETGRNNEKASIISRVCSRLIIHRVF